MAAKHYTNGEIAAAAERAADFIEDYPQRYEFSEVRVPKRAEDTACAVGWLMFFLGDKGVRGELSGGNLIWHGEVAGEVIRIYGQLPGQPMSKPSVAAESLRRYARYKRMDPPRTPEPKGFFRRLIWRIRKREKTHE